jgi:hypothetical protein
MGELMEGAVQQAPQPGRQSMGRLGAASVRLCGIATQAVCGPQHLVHHGAHAVCMGLLHQMACLIKRTAS